MLFNVQNTMDFIYVQQGCFRAPCTHTHIPFTALCPGLPSWAGTRKVKPIWIFIEARDSEWQWHQLGHMQVCTSLQPAPHYSVFYRSDALPAAQPTVSKHWRQSTLQEGDINRYQMLVLRSNGAACSNGATAWCTVPEYRHAKKYIILHSQTTNIFITF